MEINYEAFTPIQSLVGGILIGGAALLMMASLGRIMGVSGIVSAALTGPDRSWRIAFIAGTLAAPVLYHLVAGSSTSVITENKGLLAAGGLLVGVGTKLGSGCTSGHGICGLARFSRRSLAAVMIFMATAMLTVTIASWGV